jgi:octaprenyl-diphosphate synthase
VTNRSRGPSSGAAALKDVQAPVSDALERVVSEMWRIVATDSDFIQHISEHLLLMKGKMLRPTMLLLSSELEGAAESRNTAYAAVAELIHLATLVHDDAVDHSVLRRGMPTVNALYSHQVSVIMGDFLYSRALQELVRLGDLEPLAVFTKASNDLTLGEMWQLAALDALAFSEEDYERLIRTKTAALFSATCEVGALCGARTHRQGLRNFGELFGMAFQIADDLLDYTEDSETTGKPAGLDLREHKVTLPLIAALRTVQPSGRQVIDALFTASEPSDAQIAAVVSVVREEGGLDYARRRGDEYAARADEAISAIPESPARNALMDALDYVMDRRS